MSWQWPWFLALLLQLPLWTAVYVWVLRRRRKYAVRFSNLALIREALPRYARWRQHLPFALFLLALAGLTVALARPVVATEVPLNRTTIILALDISRSMCATDISPNRLSVAQEAALAFIDEQAAGTQIGVVAFAGFAELIVPPTNDKEVLTTAVRNLTTSLGTAIGSATLKSIDAIAEINPNVARSGVNLRRDGTPGDLVEPHYLPEIIVLLTDGANSQGPLPLDAAQQAADRQLRVYTIGFGTTELSEMVCSQQQIGSDAFAGGFGGGFGGFSGGFGGGNFRRFLVLDEPTLRGVAELTGGDYYRAESAAQLNEVFRELPAQIVLQKQTIELSVVFTAVGALLATLALTLSLVWRRL